MIAGEAEVDDGDDWMSLGVWAMVQVDQKESNHIIQQASFSQPIHGLVNLQTQRAAWKIGDNSNVALRAS